LGGDGFSVFPVLRVDERELREFERANLAHFKTPRSESVPPRYFFLFPCSFLLSALPKTATGKIQKYVLRAQRPAIAPQ
jgi:acyl-CoA synthetase (AMP-forming)/AMP-acid ligase II